MTRPGYIAWIAVIAAVLLGLALSPFWCTAAGGATYYAGPTATGDHSGSDAANLKAWSDIGTGNTIYIRGMTSTISGSTWPANTYWTTDVNMYDSVRWTFNTDYRCGQFVTGDIWISTGTTVSITAICPVYTEATQTWYCTPSTHNHSWAGLRKYNGSMLNPVHTVGQAYDSETGAWACTVWSENGGRMYSAWGNSGTLCLPGGNPISVGNPLVITPDASLLSARCYATCSRPCIQCIAVLTILSTPPAATSFRPGYCGSTKTVYSSASLRTNLLPSLNPVSGTLNVATVAGLFSHPWIDHQNFGGMDGCQYLGPTDNQPNYGGEQAIVVGAASLMTMLDDTQLIASYGGSKISLVNALVQLGIDYYSGALNGAAWWDGGCLAVGKKLAILYAGYLLNDAGMLAIGASATQFCEDRNTWYVVQGDVGRYVTDMDGTYIQGDVGLPEWGEQHTRDSTRDDRRIRFWTGGVSYRKYNDWVDMSQALPVQMLGLKSQWNHPAWIEYADRAAAYFIPTEETLGVYDTYANFSKAMWVAYRANYPPVWPATDTPAIKYYLMRN